MEQIKLKTLALEEVLKEMAGRYDSLDKVLDALVKRKITKEQAKRYIMVLNYNDDLESSDIGCSASNIGSCSAPIQKPRRRTTYSSQGGISCGSSSVSC